MAYNWAEYNAALTYGYAVETMAIATIRSLTHTRTNLAKEANWAGISMSTAQGAALLDSAYQGSTFDGRYVYFAPRNSDTFLRYDTQGVFITTTAWEKMNMSTAQGVAEIEAAYYGAIFDGRYVYYVPYGDGCPFLRFDTQGTSFITAADWQQMSASTAQGGAMEGGDYFGSTFDGRYIYYAPWNSDTFIRFDTQGTSFTTVGDWQKMNMSTALGASGVDAAYEGCTFDGRYVYYAPQDSASFLRFDTEGTSFTTAADWQKMSMSTAQGATALVDAYSGCNFDGRYVYFSPYDSDTFLRFDTEGTSFTTAADWQKMSMSTAQGAATLDAAYSGVAFDGRYIHFTPRVAATFLRFDTQGGFATVGDWQRISMSTAQGSALVTFAYGSPTFDGRYVYFTPYHADFFLRFAGLWSSGGFGKEGSP